MCLTAAAATAACVPAPPLRRDLSAQGVNFWVHAEAGCVSETRPPEFPRGGIERTCDWVRRVKGDADYPMPGNIRAGPETRNAGVHPFGPKEGGTGHLVEALKQFLQAQKQRGNGVGMLCRHEW